VVRIRLTGVLHIDGFLGRLGRLLDSLHNLLGELLQRLSQGLQRLRY
jgi:hypothetical protein